MDKTILFSTQWYERRVHLGVLEYARDHRWDVISSHHMPGLVFEAPDVDGQIVEIGPRETRRLRLTEAFQGPVVGMEDFGDGLDIPRVHTDNRAVGRLAARHLLDRGFLRFATVCRDHFQYVQDRFGGFHDEIGTMKGSQCLDIRSNGAPQQGELLSPDRDIISSLESLLSLERPIGVFCADDEDASRLIRFLERARVAVPEEIAVIGVNDDPLICPFTSAPLSSIDPGFGRIGYKAAQLLDRLMQGKPVPSKVHLVKPTGVVIRRSSDIRAVPDLTVSKTLRYIWDHAETRLTIADIAAHVDLPVRTLQWRFSKWMGYPIQHELTKTRVKRVQQELLQTTKSTGQIAEDLNFSSVQYMIRMFSKETGVSPLKYRRSHQEST
jgi:LacI family transcriptional regulator